MVESPDLHRRKRARAAPEALALHAEPLERGQPEIGQLDTFALLGRAHDVALMLEAASGEDHREIAVGVGGAVAHAAADHHERAVHQSRLLELPEEMRELRDQIFLHDLQLGEQTLLFTVV